MKHLIFTWIYLLGTGSIGGIITEYYIPKGDWQAIFIFCWAVGMYIIAGICPFILTQAKLIKS